MAKKRANGEGNIRKRADGRWEGRYTAGYHPETGKRIIKITDAEGKPLEAHQRVYTAAVMDQTFPEDAIQSLTDTGISIQALLTETIQSRKTITPGKDGRFIIR